MSLTCFVHWSCSASLDHSVFRYTAEDHLYMESSAGAAAFNVALEGMAPALRNMFKELLAVARQDGTFYCFQSLVRQVEAAPRYSVKTCAAESVLPLASHVGKPCPAFGKPCCKPQQKNHPSADDNAAPVSCT
jgi:hypothetical protein